MGMKDIVVEDERLPPFQVSFCFCLFVCLLIFCCCKWRLSSDIVGVIDKARSTGLIPPY